MNKNIRLRFTYERGGKVEIVEAYKGTNCTIIIDGNPMPVVYKFTRADDIEADWPDEMKKLLAALNLQFEAGERARASAIAKLLEIRP